MVAPLRQENHDKHVQVESQQKYQTFQDFNHSEKFRELIFFARIALFSILTVCISFGLLMLHLPTLLVFLFAILISLAITSTVSTFIWHLLK